ncbi:hypothetical protein B0E38_04732 [Streptomyces sp. 111WW2]|uniref:helix-turn-helix domain-containing protein n=1 Tax=Streptomyces sp. 111WW2 TaxID=1945515 RepID=UPI000D0C7C56|nr:helix-turn-helix domain-containing protein [Streptomyces sp. 111WW2]PSK52406.1 hypothetical protein B0E38_04732 [Streptomyces sp. 111WW2]
MTKSAERSVDWLAAVRRVVGAPETATWWRGLDLVAIVRAAERRGASPVLDDEEQRVAALAMTENGVGGREAAARLGTNDRQVSRWREAAGLVGGDCA